MAKLKELDQHCGNCGVMDLCGEPFSEICLCAREEIGELTEEEYRQQAEEIRKKWPRKGNKAVEKIICKRMEERQDG